MGQKKTEIWTYVREVSNPKEIILRLMSILRGLFITTEADELLKDYWEEILRHQPGN